MRHDDIKDSLYMYSPVPQCKSHTFDFFPSLTTMLIFFFKYNYLFLMNLLQSFSMTCISSQLIIFL